MRKTMPIKLEDKPMTKQSNPHAKVANKDITIEVIAKSDGSGGVIFSQDLHGNGSGGKIDLPRDSGPYSITFDLDAEKGLDIRFDASGPIFCAVDNGSCPTSVATEQIMVDSCDKDDLVVIDWNYGLKQELRYQLNFVSSAGEKMPCYDPIIVNGGGTKISL